MKLGYLQEILTLLQMIEITRKLMGIGIARKVTNSFGFGFTTRFSGQSLAHPLMGFGA